MVSTRGSTAEPFAQVAAVAGLIVILLGCTILAGWILGVPSLTRGFAGATTTKVNTALCFVLVGVSLYLQAREPASSWRKRTAQACAGLAGAVGALTVTEYLLGIDLGIDRLLLRAPMAAIAGSPPGRMAPNTALGFALLGTVLVFLDSRVRAVELVSPPLVILVFSIGFVAVAGYFYSVRALYDVPGFTSMAIPTAVGIVTLSTGVLAARPRRAPVSIVAQDNLAGAALRRLLPVVLVLPLLVGGLCLKGEQAGWYGTDFELGLIATGCAMILAAVTVWNGHVQGAAEDARRQTVDDERLLYEVGERLRMSTDSGAALFEVATRFGEYLGVSRCMFTEVDLEQPRVIVHRDYHRGLDSLAGISLIADLSPEVLAEARAGGDVVSNDTKVDPRTAGRYDQRFGPAGVGACIVVPLLTDGIWVAALSVTSQEPRVWQQREVALARTVAERTWLWFERIAAVEALNRREHDLAVSEARKAAVLNSAFDAIVSMDHAGVVVEFNPAAERLFGYRREDAVGKAMATLLIPPSRREAHIRGFARYLETGEGPFFGKVVELPAMRADGTEFPAELAIMRVVGQEPPLFTAFARDITERRRAVERFRLAVEAAPAGMLMISDQGRIVLVNQQVERLFGYSRDELVGRPVEMLLPEAARRMHPELRGKFFARPSTRPMGAGRDLYGVRKDGTEIALEIGLSPIEMAEGTLVLSSVVDLSERRRAEAEREDLLGQLRALNADLEERVRARTQELATTLREREVLLQEVHHRVKNNLQLIGSLMNMQVRQLSDASARGALEECQTRVEAIALIHDKLYRTRDYARIPFSAYARSLAGNILHATGVSPDTVDLSMNIDSLEFAVDKAIPCGLILNELITNALKHAFPDDRHGRITVDLHQAPEGEILLSVADDGVGLAEDFQVDTSSSLGLQLVSTLVEQLEGRLEIAGPGGARFSVAFPAESIAASS